MPPRGRSIQPGTAVRGCPPRRCELRDPRLRPSGRPRTPDTARRPSYQITLFKSLGMAVEDVATAGFAYAQAQARRVGDEVSLE
ncbi:MAG TPA: hypothetical protein VGX75_14465 [bacterium]|nr:hypothetical protein [bacterium]